MYPRKKMRLLAGRGLTGESVKAKTACNDFLLLGPKRSLVLLAEEYRGREERQEGTAPTVSRSTLEKWSSAYRWASRAEEYDARRLERREHEVERVLDESFARLDVRLKDLVKKAELLSKEVEEPEKLWGKDYRTVGYGQEAQEREIRVFNHQLVKEYRGVLEDIAKEVGARRVETGVDVTLTLKGYAKVDAEGGVFDGPDAWDGEAVEGNVSEVEPTQALETGSIDTVDTTP